MAINTNQDESKRPAKGSKQERAEEMGKEQLNPGERVRRVR